MRAPVLLLALLAPVAFGQASPPDSLRPADRARALIAQDERGDALRLVNRALDEVPGDPELLTIRLQLQQEGIGLFGRPPFARRMARAATARRLLDADSTSPHAHDELGRQGLDDYLFDRDYINVATSFGDVGITHERTLERTRPRGTDAEGFNRGGRYDLDRLRATYPLTGRPGMGRLLRETRGHLDAAVRHGGADFAESLATLLVAEQDADALLALAETTDDDLLRGAALFRLGNVTDADEAFSEALRTMPEAEARDLDDPRRARPRSAVRDVEGFWEAEDPRLLTAPNERLLEHRTRVVEADRLFGWPGHPGRDTPRGQIYVRYGAPADRATMDEPFYPGDAHMTQGGDAVMSPHFEVWEYASGLRYVFSDPVWSGEYAVYSPSALAFTASLSAEADDYIAQDERLKRDHPDASQYEAQESLTVVLDVVPFRGEAGRTDLVIASEVAVADPGEIGDVRSGAWILRGGEREAEALDESGSLVPLVDLPSGTIWTRAAQLSTTSGQVAVHAEVGDADDRAAGWARETIQVPAWGGGLQLSGLLLARALDEGRAPGPGEVARGGAVIQPAPGGSFGVSDPVALYAEVYGLDANAGDARYTVRAALVPVDGRAGIVRAIGGLFGRGRRRGVAVEVEETVDGSTAPIALFLDASRQRPGTYTLTLTITDLATRGVVEASREVTLL